MSTTTADIEKRLQDALAALEDKPADSETLQQSPDYAGGSDAFRRALEAYNSYRTAVHNNLTLSRHKRAKSAEAIRTYLEVLTGKRSPASGLDQADATRRAAGGSPADLRKARRTAKLKTLFTNLIVRRAAQRTTSELTEAVSHTSLAQGRTHRDTSDLITKLFKSAHVVIFGVHIATLGGAVGPVIIAAVVVHCLEAGYKHYKVKNNENLSRDEKRKLIRETWADAAFVATTRTLAGLTTLNLDFPVDKIALAAGSLVITARGYVQGRRKREDYQRAEESGLITAQEARKLKRRTWVDLSLVASKRSLGGLVAVDMFSSGPGLVHATLASAAIIIAKYAVKSGRSHRDIRIDDARGWVEGESREERRTRRGIRQRKLQVLAGFVDDVTSDLTDLVVKNFTGTDGKYLGGALGAAIGLVVVRYAGHRLLDREHKKTSWSSTATQAALGALGVTGKMGFADSQVGSVALGMASLFVVNAYGRNSRRQVTRREKLRLLFGTEEFTSGMFTSVENAYGSHKVKVGAQEFTYTTTVKDFCNAGRLVEKIRDIAKLQRTRDPEQRKKKLDEKLDSLRHSVEWTNLEVSRSKPGADPLDLQVPTEVVEEVTVEILQLWNSFQLFRKRKADRREHKNRER